MFIYPDLSLPEMILALETDATIFPAGMTLRLYTNDLTPTRTTVVADLTELTNVEVPGYILTTPAWNGTPLRKQDGSWEDWTDQNAFMAIGGPPPAPIVVFGWFVTNAAKTVLAASGRLAAPFVFVQDGDGFSLKARLNVDQVAGDEEVVVTDMVVE